MNDPDPQTLTEWTWNKVATSVLTGTIDKISPCFWYYQTYRLTGEAAPDEITDEELPTEAIRMFQHESQEEIKATALIDVYVLPVRGSGSDEEAMVRVNV